MITYPNEAAFSNALVKALRNKGWFVQRIESGLTGKGIPDIYTITPTNVPVWFELKRERRPCIQQCEIISWRPGQQTWLHNVVKRNQLAYTLAAFDNGIVQIPHTVIWPQNIVDISVCEWYESIGKMFS